MREDRFDIVRDERTSRSYKIVHHSSGLDILLAPMKDFVQTSAMIGTKYGSVNNCFKTDEDEDFVRVPDGIAHYLEHKLFENDDSDVFELFAETGADANAMTGFENTIYLFSCTENFCDSLRILLDFVQKPYFTQENVDKERGIIAQEIKMTLDLPKRRCFFELLNAMYHVHPIKIDIAGSVESIEEITPELLYKCYDSFYDLNNMALAIAGNFDEEEALAICDELLVPCKDKKLEVSFPDEPYEVVKRRTELKFSVGVPMFEIGFKCRPAEEKLMVKREVEADLLLSLLAGRMSPMYKELTSGGLINSELGREVFDSRGVFSLILSGESNDPDAVLECVLKHIRLARENGLDRAQFELLKKAEYGMTVRELNTPDGYAENMLAFHFYGLDTFELQRRIAQVTFEDIEKALDELIDTENYSISIIR